MGRVSRRSVTRATSQIPNESVRAFAFVSLEVARLGERHSFKKLILCGWLLVAGCVWFVFRSQLLEGFCAFCAFLRPISSCQRTVLNPIALHWLVHIRLGSLSFFNACG